MARFARIVLLGCALAVGVASTDVAAARARLQDDDVADDGLQVMMLARFAANDPPPGAVRVPGAQLPPDL